jgi:iron complex transport system permease protein
LIQNPQQKNRALLALLALLFIAIALRLFVTDRMEFAWPTGEIAPHILHARSVRVQLAVLVGMALAGSGVALQALLRNHLASPFVLGLSSGAALGVITQQALAISLGHTLGAEYTGALWGAALSMIIVYAASRRRGAIDPLGLLLIGVVLDTINGAAIMSLNYFADASGLRDDIARWMMGYLNEAADPRIRLIVALATLAGLTLLFISGKAMDAATFSDAEARSVGVNLSRLRIILFVTASALAAGAVTLAGPVAFVGLICPHLARLLFGPTHKTLLIASVLCGASLMLLADTASVGLDFGQGQLPLGIFTAILGGPVFIAMLRSQLGRASD